MVFGIKHSFLQWEIRGLPATVAATEPSNLAGLLTDALPSTALLWRIREAPSYQPLDQSGKLNYDAYT
jgi:hypothetical protein